MSCPYCQQSLFQQVQVQRQASLHFGSLLEALGAPSFGTPFTQPRATVIPYNVHLPRRPWWEAPRQKTGKATSEGSLSS